MKISSKNRLPNDKLLLFQNSIALSSGIISTDTELLHKTLSQYTAVETYSCESLSNNMTVTVGTIDIDWSKFVYLTFAVVNSVADGYIETTDTSYRNIAAECSVMNRIGSIFVNIEQGKTSAIQYNNAYSAVPNIYCRFAGNNKKMNYGSTTGTAVDTYYNIRDMPTVPINVTLYNKYVKTYKPYFKNITFSIMIYGLYITFWQI